VLFRSRDNDTGPVRELPLLELLRDPSRGRLSILDRLGFLNNGWHAIALAMMHICP